MVVINNEKCIGCGLCVSDCVADNIVIENGKATLINSCLQCGHCVSICPMNAVTIPDYDMNDVEDFDEKRFGFDIDNLMHTIKQRRSIRQFEDKKIEAEKLEKSFRQAAILQQVPTARIAASSSCRTVWTS